MMLEVDFQSVDADLAGELLRDLFFDQKGELGCYSTFDLKKGVVDAGRTPIQMVGPDEKIEDDNYYFYNKFVHFNTGIEMRYFWNGDGELIFILPNQTVFANTDCKKTHDWKKYKNWQDFVRGKVAE
jgi:hypothetical protein